MQPVVKEGKEFSIEDDKGTKEIILRSKGGVYMAGVYSKTLEDQGTIRLFEGTANTMVQDSKGRFLIISSPKRVVAIDLSSKKTVFESFHTYVHYVDLSPGQKFLQIFDKQDASKGETKIFSLPDFKEVHVLREGMSTLFISKENYPLAKFSSDDKLMCRYNSKSIEMYGTTDFTLVGTINSSVVKFFKLSPKSTIEEFHLVTVILDDKSNSGMLTIYNKKSLQDQKHWYIKNIDKAEEVKIKFNPSSNDFLIEVQTYFDTSGKSYYGEYGLYFFNSKEKKLQKVRTYEGPIHDFAWDPTGQKFIVISGFMPANSVMFSNTNDPILQFGRHHKNTIYWNPQGRFVCLAGYGNLNGEMEVWDVDELKKVGVTKSNSASYCLWSPDGRKMLTAVVTPRLRVDNDYKVFSYSGSSLKTFDLSWTELYDVIWRNTSEFKNDRRGASPNRLLLNQEKTKEKKLFRPIGSSSITNALLSADTSNSNQPRIFTKHQKFEITRAPTSTGPVIMNQFPEEQEKPKKKKKKNKQGV